jgi:hypothetical protein
MKEGIVSRIRRFQVIFSVVIFIFVTIMCHLVTGFNISEIQLSTWGEDNLVGGAWNSLIIFMSFTILSNVTIWIYQHPRLKYKPLFYGLFWFASINLFFVGFYPVQYGLLHIIPAIIYFFTYPLIIFLMVFMNRNNIIYREWLKHTIISLLMITIPLLFITFNGMGIYEIVHASMVGLWNLIILKKHKK